MPELTLDQALAELPDTPDGIADRMRALGIKGMRRDICCCPLANYLRQLGFRGAAVGGGLVVVPGTLPHRHLPAAASLFEERFDAGVYLDLVEVSS